MHVFRHGFRSAFRYVLMDVNGWLDKWTLWVYITGEAIIVLPGFIPSKKLRPYTPVPTMPRLSLYKTSSYGEGFS